MVFTTDGFFEVALESWPEWDLNPRPQNSVQMLKPTELSSHEFNSHPEPTLYSYSNFIVCSVPHFISSVCLRQSPRLFNRGFLYTFSYSFAFPSFTCVIGDSWVACIASVIILSFH